MLGRDKHQLLGPLICLFSGANSLLKLQKCKVRLFVFNVLWYLPTWTTPWKINGWNIQITHLERKMIGTKPPGNYVPAVNLPGCMVYTFRPSHIFNSETKIGACHQRRDPCQFTPPPGFFVSSRHSISISSPIAAWLQRNIAHRPSHLPVLLKMGGTVYLPTFIVDPCGKLVSKYIHKSHEIHMKNCTFTIFYH